MFGWSKVARLVAILTGAAALSVGSGVAPASASSSTASASTAVAVIGPLPVDSVFNFCNTTGGKIGCFIAHLHYVSRNEFTLSDVQVQDTLNDSRSVIADIYNQDGWLGEFVNSQGPNTTASWEGPIPFSYPYGTKLVYVRLYACNNNPFTPPCSRSKNSRTHGNPYW